MKYVVAVLVTLAMVLALFGAAQANVVQLLPLPSGNFNQSFGRGINDQDWIVGVAFNSPAYQVGVNHPWTPFYWDPGQNASYVLGGMTAFGHTDLDAGDISNISNGKFFVAGYTSVTDSTPGLPWIWYSDSSTFSLLPHSGGYSEWVPTNILENGTDTIIYGIANGTPVKWTLQGSDWVFDDSNVVSPVFPDYNALGNTKGSSWENGIWLAVLKGDGHQVPEPSTFLLFGLGLIGLGIRAKRRCTRRQRIACN